MLTAEDPSEVPSHVPKVTIHPPALVYRLHITHSTPRMQMAIKQAFLREKLTKYCPYALKDRNYFESG